MTAHPAMTRHRGSSSPRGVPLCGDEAATTGWDERACPWPRDTAERVLWIADWHRAIADMWISAHGGPKEQTPEQVRAERDLLLLSQRALLARVARLTEDLRRARATIRRERAVDDRSIW